MVEAVVKIAKGDLEIEDALEFTQHTDTESRVVSESIDSAAAHILGQ